MFKDRADAGQQLATALREYHNRKEGVVLGLARGGVVVAAVIAQALHLPLGVVVVRKVGAPGNEELGIGAVTEKGEAVVNPHLIAVLGVSQDYLQREIERQRQLAKTRSKLYSGHHVLELKGKIVILVDDGIATGSSMRAAIQEMRAQKVKQIILAVPVASPDSLRTFEKEVDQIVCLSTPVMFQAVAQAYKSFPQVTDDQVITLLHNQSQ
jgi:putative phosphoribosyl transferase